MTMTSKDFAIGILSVTAVVLVVGLLIINVAQPERAYGIGQNAASGDYLVSTGQVDMLTELLYVVDAGVEQLNVYGFNTGTGRIELIRTLDIRFRPGDRRAPAKAPAQGRGK